MTGKAPESVRNLASSIIGNFLYEEGLGQSRDLRIRAGLMRLVDKIDDYYEEGVRLYPEVLVSDCLEMLLSQLPPHRRITIERTDIDRAFERAMKYCAPLACDGWVIFISLKGNDAEYGVVSAEDSELSAPIYRHFLGDLVGEQANGAFAYLRCVSPRRVVISGSKAKLSLNLSFDHDGDEGNPSIHPLVDCIARDVDPLIAASTKSYFSRLLEEAIRESHGCMIGVIEDTTEANAALMKHVVDATFLPTPLDLVDCIRTSEELKSRSASTALRSLSSVAKGMIRQDCATIFTTTGKLIAFRAVIPRAETASAVIAGGTRRRAFESLKACGCFVAGLFRSQDGLQQIWERR